MGRMTNDRRPSLVGVWLAVLLAVPMTGLAQGPGTENGAWTYLGGDAWHTRYTTADEIDALNFEELEVAWTFNAGSFGPSTPRATPTYIDGKLITVSGDRRHVIALDPSTGELLWSFTEPNTHRWEYSMRAGYGKGIAYSEVDGRGVVFITSPAFFLHALDAETGRPLEGWGRPVPLDGFGESGTVDQAIRDHPARGWDRGDGRRPARAHGSRALSARGVQAVQRAGGRPERAKARTARLAGAEWGVRGPRAAPAGVRGEAPSNSGSGRAKASAATVGVAQCIDLQDLDRGPALHDELGDTHTDLDLERRLSVVDQDDADLAAIALVDRARRVEHGHGVPTREPAPRAHLGFRVGGKLDGDTGRNRRGLTRRDHRRG